jgi:O-antigen ligase
MLALTSRRWWQKALLLAIGLLEVNAIFFSMSRGAMLGLGVSGLVLFLVVPKKPVHYAVFLAAVALALRLAGPSVREEFATSFASKQDRDGSAQGRLDLWLACWDIMLKNPILGVGPDHFPTIAHEYGFNRGKEAHSMWFQLGAELGIPGVSSLMLFYILAACLCIRLIRSPSYYVSDKVRNVARMVLPAIAGYSVAAQFITMEGVEIPYYLIMLVAVGVIISSNAERGAAMSWSDGTDTDEESRQPEPGDRLKVPGHR